MKEELVTFKTAKLAKEKGFDWPSFYMYNIKFKESYFHSYSVQEYNEQYYVLSEKDFLKSKLKKDYIIAPTQSLLQKWLRNVHKLHATVDIEVSSEYTLYYPVLTQSSTLLRQVWYKFGYFPRGIDNNKYLNPTDTYEEALEEGLLYALNLIKL